MSKTTTSHIPCTDSLPTIYKREVFVVWTNTDLTEGRGSEYVLALCETESTAYRIGKGRYVQGCDCEITKAEIFYVKGLGWMGPIGRVIEATPEDHKQEKENASKHEKKILLDRLERGEEMTAEDRRMILELLGK